MRRVLTTAAAAALAGAFAAAAEEGAPAFTHAQAEHGGEVYAERCASCHGSDLNNGEFGPSLKGARFARKWGGRSLAELYDYMSKQMPPGQAGVLAGDDYADLMAFLLEAGGAPAGPKALPADPKALATMAVPKG
jgi:mono/diheme cytochrome c family protein